MSRRTNKHSLKLGSDVVRVLLPQRPPFLMVDFVESFDYKPTPTLRAGRHISANEAVFEGHFPDFRVWPGALTIEGLGQSCNLLYLLVGLSRGYEEHGHDPECLLDELRNLQLGYTMQPGYRADGSQTILDVLASPIQRIGFTAAVDVKLTRPVFAGCRLDYLVTVNREIDDLVRFQIEATVDGQLVAKGTMTSLCRDFALPGR